MKIFGISLVVRRLRLFICYGKVVVRREGRLCDMVFGILGKEVRKECVRVFSLFLFSKGV